MKYCNSGNGIEVLYGMEMQTKSKQAGTLRIILNIKQSYLAYLLFVYSYFYIFLDIFEDSRCVDVCRLMLSMRCVVVGDDLILVHI